MPSAEKRHLAGDLAAIFIWYELATIRRWVGADGLSFAEWHPRECLEGGW